MEPVARKYAMTDAALALAALKFVTVLNRDLTTLAKYGMTSGKITAFAALRQQFAEFPSDDDVKEATTEATAAKKAARDVIADAVRYFGRGIKKVFGEDSQRYKNLRISDLDRMSDDDIFLLGLRLPPKLTAVLTELTPQGVTAADITALTASVAAFQALLEAQEVENDFRRDQTVKRVEKGNELYDLYVAYADDGKLAMRNDPAKYPDYVIYEDAGIPQTPADAPVITGVTGTTLSITADPTATSHELETSENNATWSAPQNFTGLTVEITPPAPGGTRYYRARSWNNGGLSPYSAVFTLVIAGLAPVSGFHYTQGVGFAWNPTAEDIEFHASYDGGNTWNEIAAGQIPSGVYNWVPPAGQFRIRRKSGAVVSAWVVIDVTTP